MYGDEEKLGRGGQGEALKATNEKTGEVVVVKLFHAPDGLSGQGEYYEWSTATEDQKKALQ